MYLDGYADSSWTAVRFGAIVPELVFAGEYWRLFTYMFVHFGFIHLLANTGGLLIIGLRVEKCFGHVAFLAVYLIGGLAASLCSLFFTQGFAAGASGAIFALDGAAFAYTRIAKRPIDELTDQVMLMYIIVGIAMGFGMGGVDNAAHVGGLVAGLLLGALITKIKLKKEAARGGSPA
jgi:rhomboid protease GluP